MALREQMPSNNDNIYNMDGHLSWTVINAVHVMRSDGVHVEFINQHQLQYRTDDCVVTFDCEASIGSNGAPDGTLLEFGKEMHNGEKKLSTEEIAQIVEDIKEASELLRTKILFKHEFEVEPVGSGTPIRGFTVLSIAYPNHLHTDSKHMSNYDIALRLSHDIDVEWFGNDPAFGHFGTTLPLQGNSENEEAFGFDFGPSDDRSKYCTVIVRETAGGGFMLLLQNEALEFSEKVTELFNGIIADTERENPELPHE
jgi:hypothetical protein